MEVKFEHEGKSYEISFNEGNSEFSYWLENEDGEGMSMSAKNLFDIFDEHFKKEF